MRLCPDLGKAGILEVLMEIKVVHNPAQSELDKLGVSNWPIWEKEVSEFPWTYSMTEVCYILDGEVTVTPDGGEPVTIRPGDLVTFPNGLSCTWKITKDVRKHYNFE
jgi:uncharacterized cupin superfamily protein